MPIWIRSSRNEKDAIGWVNARYQDGYFDEEREAIICNSNGFFDLYIQYIGDRQVTINTTDIGMPININSYDAVWYTILEYYPGNAYDNGSLHWIQDGYYVILMPCDIEWDYMLAVAESLAPILP